MDISVDWQDVGWRLLLTLVAGSVIGFDRQEHGRPAGLRTTVLVCLTASASMILAGLIADSRGRPSDSYVTMDVMRLPLGVLTGMGFIGAGAILHKGNFVMGVTTAATLWFATIMGFCFGSGHFGLGGALLAIAVGILWGLRWVERHAPRRNEAAVTVVVAHDGPTQEEILGVLDVAGYKFSTLDVEYSSKGRRFRFDVSHHAPQDEKVPPAPLQALARQSGVIKLSWRPHP